MRDPEIKGGGYRQTDFSSQKVERVSKSVGTLPLLVHLVGRFEADQLQLSLNIVPGRRPSRVTNSRDGQSGIICPIVVLENSRTLSLASIGCSDPTRQKGC